MRNELWKGTDETGTNWFIDRRGTLYNVERGCTFVDWFDSWSAARAAVIKKTKGACEPPVDEAVGW